MGNGGGGKRDKLGCSFGEGREGRVVFVVELGLFCLLFRKAIIEMTRL